MPRTVLWARTSMPLQRGCHANPGKSASRSGCQEDIPAGIVEALKVTKEDFQEALRKIEPSAMREVFVEVAEVHWDEVGGLEAAKQSLIEAVKWPLDYPEAFAAVGVRPTRGILLYGLPGTGKTLLVRALATESSVNFISVKGPELLSKWWASPSAP